MEIIYKKIRIKKNWLKKNLFRFKKNTVETCAQPSPLHIKTNKSIVQPPTFYNKKFLEFVKFFLISYNSKEIEKISKVDAKFLQNFSFLRIKNNLK